MLGVLHALQHALGRVAEQPARPCHQPRPQDGAQRVVADEAVPRQLRGAQQDRPGDAHAVHEAHAHDHPRPPARQARIQPVAVAFQLGPARQHRAPAPAPHGEEGDVAQRPGARAHGQHPGQLQQPAPGGDAGQDEQGFAFQQAAYGHGPVAVVGDQVVQVFHAARLSASGVASGAGAPSCCASAVRLAACRSLPGWGDTSWGWSAPNSCGRSM